MYTQLETKGYPGRPVINPKNTQTNYRKPSISLDYEPPIKKLKEIQKEALQHLACIYTSNIRDEIELEKNQLTCKTDGSTAYRITRKWVIKSTGVPLNESREICCSNTNTPLDPITAYVTSQPINDTILDQPLQLNTLPITIGIAIYIPGNCTPSQFDFLNELKTIKRADFLKRNPFNRIRPSIHFSPPEDSILEKTCTTPPDQFGGQWLIWYYYDNPEKKPQASSMPSPYRNLKINTSSPTIPIPQSPVIPLSPALKPQQSFWDRLLHRLPPSTPTSQIISSPKHPPFFWKNDSLQK